jgi:hypothetical protein
MYSRENKSSLDVKMDCGSEFGGRNKKLFLFRNA